MSDTKARVSPIVAIAAVSLIVFSAVGVGVMTGLIPSSFSKPAEQPQPVVAAPAPTQQAQPQPAAPAPRRAAQPPARVAAAEPARAAQICADCGTVLAVNAVKREGEGTGLGAVAGGVVGGVIGNQIGSGGGRRIATVAGAAGGAYAGHQIEKHVRSGETYNVTVRMDDGTTRTFHYEQAPAVRAGDKVKVVDGVLVRS